MNPFVCIKGLLLGGALALVAAALPLHPAAAQETIPALQLDRTGGAATRSFQLDTAPVFNYPNSYMNEALALQYQNVLLEKMIVRQGIISRTEKSFQDVGVPFKSPAPPRGICEQIPANVPCYKAYPDLYPGAVPEIAQIEDSVLADDSGTQAAAPADAAPQQPEKPAEPAGPDFSAYSWAEVMCAGGRCTAVVIKDSARQTVREGDSIGEGIRVTSISAQGVRVSKDGTSENLRSALAPSRGGVASPKFDGSGARRDIRLTGGLSNQAAQLEELFASPPPDAVGQITPISTGDTPAPANGISTSTPAASIPPPPAAASGGNGNADTGYGDDDGTLGPTGLF